MFIGPITVLGAFLYIVILVLMANFVHKDAIQRNARSPEVWVLITLLFSVLGLVIYLICRGNYNPLKGGQAAPMLASSSTIAQRSGQLDAPRVFSAVPLGTEIRFCSWCGTKLFSGSNFCLQCGTPVIYGKN